MYCSLADEMDIKNQKKAVTVDKKPDIGKKTEKNVGDAKAKPAVQTTVEKTVSTKQAVQPSSAASADTSQGQVRAHSIIVTGSHKMSLNSIFQIFIF